MGDVEAQPVGRHQRALLGDVLAEPPAQGLVQQVGRRMVGAQAGPPFAVDPQLDRVADGEAPARHLADVDVRSPRRFCVSSMRSSAAVGGERNAG